MSGENQHLVESVRLNDKLVWVGTKEEAITIAKHFKLLFEPIITIHHAQAQLVNSGDDMEEHF